MKGLAAEDDLSGQVLGGRYRVLEPLGVGGFGVVYVAEHVVTRRKFAVKVLLPELGQRQKLAERFTREATTTAKIEHENIVEIIDVGRTEAGALYFSMELLKGETLADLLARERRLPWQRAGAMMLQVCRALQAAHVHGIVHRDLKPANIFRMTRAGNPDFIKVLDFGIAKLLSGEDTEGGGLTSRREVLGTPQYMSPEQASGDVIDGRTDVYSCGVMLFEVLTGRRPFVGKSAAEVMRAVMGGRALTLAEAAPDVSLPPAMAAVVTQAMAVDPEQRYQEMGAMVAALEAALALPAAPVETSSSASGRAAHEAVPSVQVTLPAVRAQRESQRTLLLAAMAVVALGLVVAIGVTLAGRAPAPVEEQPVAPAPVVVEQAPAPVAVEQAPTPEPEPVTPPEAPTPDKKPGKRSSKRAPDCEAALVSALTKVSPARARACAQGTGVTGGDRLRLSLSGEAGRAVTVKVLESSGSKSFDGCLGQAIAAKKLPGDAKPERCTAIREFRVP